MALEAGTKLGPYEILSPLGAGGMGEVYRAKDTKLDREVAIKVLPADVASSPERLQRFEREAKTVAALNHPNIVTIFGIEESKAHRYIAMELVEGETLDRMIAPGGMPLAKIFDIAIPLADALATAHDKGIVHRDLKPANVMVTKEGRVKVLDFGLAKLTAGGQGGSFPDDVTVSAPLTGQGTVIGTVPYMSPEQLQSERVDHRTDLFSFGVMLYEMATGQRPFQGKSTVAISSAILRDTPRPLHELKSVLPRHLGRITHRCLEKDPEQRFQTAKDLRNDLRGLQEEVNTSDDSNESALTSISDASAPTSTNKVYVPAKGRHLRKGVAVVAFVGLIVGILFIQNYITGRSGQQISTKMPPEATTRLAILPFEDISPEPQQWLASGLADLVSMRLGRVNPAKLGVLGPESTRYFARADKSIQDLREDLMVDFVLQGIIQSIEKDVRITAKLIHAKNLTPVWSDEFNGTLDDPFALQSIVAERIANDLPLELTGDESMRLQKRYTKKSEAELEYMKGRFWWHEHTRNSFDKAIAHFNRAIELDEDYALAHSGLADAYATFTSWHSYPASEIANRRAKAKEAAYRALALDDTLAEVHTSVGIIAQFLDWDWKGAEASYKRAIELNPDYDLAHHMYAHVLVLLGREREAIEAFEESIRADPISTLNSMCYGAVLVGLGDAAGGERLLRQALEWNKEHGPALYYLGHALQQQDRNAEEIATYEKAHELQPGSPVYRAMLGNVLARKGQGDRARQILRELEDLSQRVYVNQMAFAKIYSGLGEIDEAFRRLDAAYEAREPWLPQIRFEPGYDNLRNDPRFAELHRKFGLGHVDLSYPATTP